MVKISKRFNKKREPKVLTVKYSTSAVGAELDINHNLDSTDLYMSITDGDGDRNYRTSYSILDSNRITVYNLNNITTSTLTVTLFANLNEVIDQTVDVF